MGKNDNAWKVLFERYNILDEIQTKGSFIISSSAIDEVREARLMAKFDHYDDLPSVFLRNRLGILPISRREYILGEFNLFCNLDPYGAEDPIEHYLPTFVQSLDPSNITSESTAMDCAYASRMINTLLNEDDIYPGPHSRMGSGLFDFKIYGLNVIVNNAQIEIDATYEGRKYISFMEAKLDLSDDFNIRQLYYPYRVLSSKYPNKPIRPIFMMYSNGVFRFFEYEFQNINVYESINLLKRTYFVIDDIKIRKDDIIDIWKNTQIRNEPDVAFPQANRFSRVVNLCELLFDSQMNHDEITSKYSFVGRQTDYYITAGVYLGLIERVKYGDERSVQLTEYGKMVMSLKLKPRQFEFFRCIFSHHVFWEVFATWVNNGIFPKKKDAECILLGNLSKDTKERRLSTAISWVKWIINLCE